MPFFVCSSGQFQSSAKVRPKKNAFVFVFVFVLAQLEGLPQFFFGPNGNFNEKMTKKIKWPKITFPGPKWFPKYLNGVLGGGICIEKWS